VSFSAFWT